MRRRSSNVEEIFPNLRLPKDRNAGAPFGPELELWAGGASVIGIDEAGRGPLAGPVVAAAVAFDPKIKLSGIDDSKALSAGRRDALEAEIQSLALAWAVEESSPERIDEINILQATREAMQRAAQRIIDQLELDWPVLLIDGRIPEIPLGRHINVIKGDSISFSIGAASILAKVHRDRLMERHDKKWPQYGFAQHKGYPTAQHRNSLLEHGPCPLHRRTFTLETGLGRSAIGDLPAGVGR